MPIYEYSCVECGVRLSEYRKVDRRDEPPSHCDAVTFRVMSKPWVRGDLEPFVSPASGKLINSRVQRDEDLARTGSFMNEPGVRQEIARTNEALRERDFVPMAASVDQTVRDFVSAGLVSGD